MHIIFGDQVAGFKDKYTLLELDTFLQKGQARTAWCVIETIPIDEISRTLEFANLHANLIVEYRKKNWNYCEQAITYLHGRWAGAADSFYDEISKRIKEYQQNDPGPDWNGTITIAGN